VDSRGLSFVLIWGQEHWDFIGSGLSSGGDRAVGSGSSTGEGGESK